MDPFRNNVSDLSNGEISDVEYVEQKESGRQTHNARLC